MSDRASRPRRARAWPVPTGWFAALVAGSGAALLFVPGRSWVVLATVEVVLLGAFALDTVRCTSPALIAVDRELPDRLRVGDHATGAWLIEHRGTRRATVTVADSLWPSLGASRRSVAVDLAPGTRVRATTTLTPTRRGRFPLGAVTVRVAGPMRLVGRQASRSVPGVLRVAPAYPSRDEVRRRLRSPRVPDVGLRTVRTVGGGTEFDQLREYRPGDDFRRIDWHASVRLQRPIVKQYRTERNQQIVVLLDNGRVMAGTVGDAPRVEHAMDAVLGLGEAAVHLSDRVGLVCFDRQVRVIVPAIASRSQLGRLAEAMYLLEPDLGESAYTDAFTSAAARFRRRSLYVVLTDLADATVERAVLPALAVLVRTHLVVVAAVRDPLVSAWAHPRAEGSVAVHDWASEAFRQAAALGALSSRERTAARLRAAGAIVVDAEPGRLAVELVDTYLELKASGRL